MALEVVKIAGLRLKLEGEAEFQAGLRKSQAETTAMRQELKLYDTAHAGSKKNVEQLTQRGKLLTEQLEAQKNKVSEVERVLEAAKTEYGENSREVQKLKEELMRGKITQEEYANAVKDNAKKLAMLESAAVQAGEKLQDMGQKMQNYGDKAAKLGKGMTTYLTVPIVGAFSVAAKSAIDFESAFAGVKKTVDATPEEFAEMEQSILDLSTKIPVAATELSKLGETAGQLGIRKENIISFTEVMANMGASTNLAGEEGAAAMAQFANIAKMSQGDFERLASSIVDLGNNGASTERDIMNMALRIAAAGTQVGMDQSKIVGLAASLTDVGLEAEAGGSAMSKLLINMNVAASTGSQANRVIADTGYSLRDLQMMASHSGKEFGELAESMGYTKAEFNNFIDASATLEGFSKVTGKTADEFKKAFEEDAAGALQLFIKGLANSKEKGLDAITVLDEMGITEVRMRDTILRSVNAHDKMGDTIARSSKAWKDNTALAEEANKRYETTESKLKLAKNEMTKVAIETGQKLTPAIIDLMGSLKDVIKWFGNLDTETQKTIITIAAVVAAAGPVLGTFGKISHGIGTVTGAIGKMVKAAGKKEALDKLGDSMSSVSTSAGNIGIAMGPLALVIGGLAAAAVSLKIAWDFTYESQNRMADAAQGLVSEIGTYPDAVNSAKSAFDGFNTSTGESAAKIQNLEEKISETQTRIQEIAKKAAEESRAYTDAEREEIEKLVGLLDAYTKIKFAAYVQQQKAYSAFVKQEQDISSARADELVKGAQDAKDQVLTIATSQYMAEIQKIEEKYGHMGELDKRAYQIAMDELKKKYDGEVKLANENFADTTQIIADKLSKQGQYESEYVSKLKKLTDEKVTENQRYVKGYKDDAVTLKKTTADILSDSVIHQVEQNRIAKELEVTYKGAAKADLDKWLAMQFQVKLYGGTISTDNQKMVDDIMTAFSTMPEGVRRDMQDSLLGAIDEMAKGNPGVTNSAQNIKNSIKNALSGTYGDSKATGKSVTEGLASGINDNAWRAESAARNMALRVNRATRSGFQIESPSKEMRAIASLNVDGIVVGTEENTYRAEKAAIRLSHKYIDSMKSGIKDIEIPDITGFTGLNKPAMSDVFTSNTTTTYAPVININNPVVRNDQDLYKIQQFVQRGMLLAQARAERR